jgi:hypothetical protein
VTRPKRYLDAVRAYMPEYFRRLKLYGDDPLPHSKTLTRARVHHIQTEFDELDAQTKADYQRISDASKLACKRAKLLQVQTSSDPAAIKAKPYLPDVLPLNALYAKQSIHSLELSDAKAKPLLMSCAQASLQAAADSCWAGSQVYAVTSDEVDDTLRSYQARQLDARSAYKKYNETCEQLGASADPSNLLLGIHLTASTKTTGCHTRKETC